MTVIEVKVMRARMVSPRVLNLRLQKPVDFSYQTGEFTLVGLPVDGKPVYRCYSLATTPSEAYLEFFIAIVPNGVISHRLAKLHEGDTVILEGTVGGMLTLAGVKPDGKDLWFFASGTGVAPFLGLLKEKDLFKKFRSVNLVHSIATWEDSQYVTERLEPHDNFRYICSASKEKTAAISVYVQESIKDGSLESIAERTLNANESRVMICGNPPMVKSLTQVLTTRGITVESGELQIEKMGF